MDCAFTTPFDQAKYMGKIIHDLRKSKRTSYDSSKQTGTPEKAAGSSKATYSVTPSPKKRVSSASTETALTAASAGSAASTGAILRRAAWYKNVRGRDRVYERLWMSFQLRTDDEYTQLGNLVGLYAANAEGEGYTGARDFRKYLQAFKDEGLLPPDWSSLDRRAVLAIADVKLRVAFTHSDVIKQFGRICKEDETLRHMAEMAIGPTGEWFECCYDT